MNQFEDDEALARLRAADPANGAHPDLHRISQRLRGRTPLSGDGGSQNNTAAHRDTLGAGGGFAFSGSDDLAVHIKDPGVRTGRGGLLVAAAVAALALGGGGYALGAATGDGPPQAGPSAPTQGTDEGTDGSRAASGSGSAAATQDSMAGDAAMGSDESEAAGGGGYAGPVVPVAGPGLSTERTTGTVYAPAPQEAELIDVLTEYAERLGIEGEVQDDGYAAFIVDTTGTPVNLNAYGQGGTISLDYSDIAVDPSCDTYRQDWIDSGGDFGWFGPGPQTPDDVVCEDVTGDVSDDAAIDTVRAFLTTAGFDPDTMKITVENEELYYATEEASPEELLGDGAAATSGPQDSEATTSAPTSDEPMPIEDDPTLMTKAVTVTPTGAPISGYRGWYFTVSSGGVAYASIQLGELVELGEYPVISQVEAVDRANDARFMQLGAYIPDLDYGDAYMEEWVEPTPLPPLSPGDAIPFPVSQSEVTNAELHTGVISMWDGTEYVVPVYDLSDDEGNHWQVLAVAEESLDFAP